MKRVTLFLAALLFSRVAFTQKVSTVFFDLNYDTTESIASVHVESGRMMKITDKPFPTRDGYRFGGWFTEPSCHPDQEWRFGSNSSFFVPATDSMKVEKSMILYAKWVTKIVGCTYVGKPSFKNVPNHVFGEIAGASEPETLTSPWGLSMNYKIENCTYKKK